MPDGSVQVKEHVADCQVTLIFKDEDNPTVMKNVTNLIMAAYHDRQKRMAANGINESGDLLN